MAQAFRRFARHEAAGRSPLYQALAEAIAEDPELLDLAAFAPPGQPPPNMLLATVQALLLEAGRDEPLARFYAGLCHRPAPPAAAFPVFRAYCLGERDAIAGLLRRRGVSTNEPGRAACLRPAFAAVANSAPEPLHIVEIGSSAGLLLLWDRYSIDYSAGLSAGPAESPLRIACEPRGGAPRELLTRKVAVGMRLGIDPNPMDVSDEADVLWLKALVWPEQEQRRRRLEAAIAMARQDRPDLRRGDALDLLPEVVTALPETGTVCLFHTFTLNQFSTAAVAAFERLLLDLSQDRLLFVVGLEWGDGEAPELRLRHFHGGEVSERCLARCDAHGAWLIWREQG